MDPRLQFQRASLLPRFSARTIVPRFMTLVTRRFARLLLAAVIGCSCLFAREPLAPPAPLAGAPDPAASETLLTQSAARRALELGFPTLAAEMYQVLLARPGVGLKENNELVTALATAYLNDNRVAEAQQVLKQFIGTPDAAVRLRLAMVAARQKRFDAARAELAQFKPADLPEHDRGWYYFLQGLLADAANDFSRSGALYEQAVESSVSELERARFILAREQAKLFLGAASDAQVATFRQNMERFSGKSLGFRAVSDLAIALNTRGDRGGAIELLQRQLQNLPREQRAVADEWSLLLGLIAGPTEGAGRNALRILLTSGADRDKQRVALQLLGRASTDSARREDFRAKLDELIQAPKPHPLLEELLLFRAELALADRKEGQANLTRAEEDANQLLERFPGSQLKGLAYGVLTNAAWERGQYRNAANLAAKAREEWPRGEMRSEFGVLVAEAYFRGNDYVSAADAYGAALNEPPSGVPAGNLMFQEVLSNIRAARLDLAAKLVDDRSRDPRFDARNRWQSEWNLTRAFQADGKINIAYDRLNRLLADTASASTIPPELLARMRWLQARLSFDVGDPRRTLALTEALLGSVEGLEATLKADILSTTLLLQVQAHYAVNEDAPSEKATELLHRLRADFPASDAAAYSFIVEADAAARKGRLVYAQGLLTSLQRDFPRSPYAPYALYQAAGYAEQRGQSANYREANQLIELLVTTYPDSELVFYARLQQGHLMRKLTEFGLAQQVYAELDNNPKFAQHPGRAAAQLALADTHAAQAASDPSHLETAQRIYERLLDLSDAPLDLRVEAGYKYGLSLARHEQPDAAIRIWGLVIGFLTQADGKPIRFGPQGRYWLARTLLEFGDLLRAQGKSDQARGAYELVVRSGLPGGDIARESISRLQPVGSP